MTMPDSDVVPDPGWENPDPMNLHFEAVPADLRWQVVEAADAMPCRWTTGPYHRTCRKPSVAKLNRSNDRKPRWWHYCGEHLYGRWIQDGMVMQWRLAEGGEEFTLIHGEA